MSENPLHIRIDFGKIHKTAHKGILRAAVFMGLGVNAADSETLKEYQLTKDTNFQLLSESVSPEILAGWKSEFRIWVVAGGFRELIDHLCVFLDRIHLVCGLIDRSDSKDEQREFERLGFDKKIIQLEVKFGVKCPFGEMLASFYPVRNCFVHRLGRVGIEDAGDKPQLSIRYMHFISVFTPEGGVAGEIPDLFDPKSMPYKTPAAGSIGVKWCEQVLNFKRGDVVALSPKQLTEMLFFADICSKEFTKAAEAFAKSRGVTPAE